VLHGPGRHSRNRNNKRNCKDKGDDPSAQRTPSANRSIVSMPPVTEHTSPYNYSLFWSKDPADVIVAVIMGWLGLWGGWQIVSQARSKTVIQAVMAE
jgi:hypothetical protein